MINPKDLADTYSVDKKMTFSAKMRTRRFKVVNEIIEAVIRKKGACNILDIGGSEYYWKLNGQFIAAHSGKLSITIANVEEDEVNFEDTELFSYRVGDCTKAELYDGPYDFIHSNSVIEHVGCWKFIRAMATNIIDTRLPYYVQTPNYWFPMEPHFRTIGFQFLPIDVRARMLLKHQRGFRKASNIDEAMQEVESVNLLTAPQLAVLFPAAEILREHFGPLTKSFMVVHNPAQ